MTSIGPTLQDHLEKARAIAGSAACRHAFLATRFDQAAAEARQLAAAAPLAGQLLSVKDLFDVEGEVTRAGSLALADAAPATADAPAVARLRAAGALLVGRTNMTEFAFSGVGVNPHYGTPVNPCDRDVARIPGGSSSGAAVSVATGAADIGLGSDTGGSIRIPAALCGLVGFKNTARLVPTLGAFPLSTTLDTVCAITRTVPEAIAAHEALAGRSVVRDARPLSAYRLAIATTRMLDDCDPIVARAFEQALARLRAAGAQLVDIPLAELRQLATLQATGGFAAPESYWIHHRLLEHRAGQYDPRVRSRIEKGLEMKAWEYLELVQARQAWIGEMERALAGFDAVLSPTVPIVAPPIAEVDAGAERDAAFFHANGLLLRNASVVNNFDGCAISLPCQPPGELPVGLMAWHGGLRDDTILSLGLQIEALLSSTSSS